MEKMVATVTAQQTGSGRDGGAALLPRGGHVRGSGLHSAREHRSRQVYDESNEEGSKRRATGE